MSHQQFALSDLFVAIMWMSAGMAAARFGYSDVTKGPYEHLAHLVSALAAGPLIANGLGTLFKRKFDWERFDWLVVGGLVGFFCAAAGGF